MVFVEAAVHAHAMTQIILIHWKPQEAEKRLPLLLKADFAALCFDPTAAGGLKALREAPPDAFVVDLSRLPSQGRDLALWLRQQKPTRRVPLVFVGGDLEKVRAIRELLPDATYTSWRRIVGDLKQALRNPPGDPVVPELFAGYSGTPLPKKLGIKAGSTVTLLGAPGEFEAVLGELPSEVRIRHRARGSADLVLLFVRSQAELRQRFPAAAKVLVERGRLWIAWPKKASGWATDLTQQGVRDYGLAADWVDFKICAIDPTWSGLCFVRRKQ